MISKIHFTKEPIILLAMSFIFSGRQRGASKSQLTNQQQQNTIKIRIALFLAIDTLTTGNLAAQSTAPSRSGVAAPTNE
jgi:hypothetical protein